jgi:glutamate/aspartate transport system ATP-binding protein
MAEPFQQGDIVVDSISVGDRKIDLPKLRSHVGMVFQHFELFPHITVTDNLAIAQIKVLGRTEEAATVKGLKLLERVGLRSASVTRVRIPKGIQPRLRRHRRRGEHPDRLKV